MADTFYIKQGANKPTLLNTLSDENGIVPVLDGTVILRLSHSIFGVFDYEAIILDQEDEETTGQVKVNDLGLKPSSADLMKPGSYSAEWRYTDSTDKLTIYPTEISPYDVPITDTIIIQKAL